MKKSINPMVLRNEMIVAAVQSGHKKNDIAEKFGITRQSVWKIMKNVEKESPMIEKYRANRADVLAWNQIKRMEKQTDIIESIKPGELENADLRVKMMALNALGLDKAREYEQERLERGQSTENVSVIVQAIREAKKRISNKEVIDVKPETD